MKLVLRSGGGFTGKAGEEVHAVDLERLSEADARSLQDLVRAADFFALPDQVRNPAPRPWDFTHCLSVSEDGREHTVTFHEDAAPPALRALVERIHELGDAGA